MDHNFYVWQVDEHNYEELSHIERDRRELLRHSKLRYRRYTYFQLWGTVIPTICKSWEWWLTASIYLMARVLLHYDIAQNTLLKLESSYISAIGSFISFLLVFYNNQGYSRYTAQYEESMRMEGRIFNAAYLARDNLPTDMAWQFVRYLNGAHILCYIGLSTEYKRRNLFSPFNEKHRVLTDDEVQRLDEIDMDTGGACYREVLGWAMNLLFQAKKGFLDMMVYSNLATETLQLRGAIGTLYDYEDQPIPYVYVHLMYSITLLYLLLFAYFVATSLSVDNHHLRDIVGVIVVSIFSMIAIGILEIGRLMSQPYKTDLSDLSVMHYINFTWMSSRRILIGKLFEVKGLKMELDLEAARPSLGKGLGDSKIMVKAANEIRCNDDFLPRQLLQTSRNESMEKSAISFLQ